MDIQEKIKQLSIDIDSPVLQAIRQMDRVDMKLLIVTRDDKYFSLVSIGDIQRAIINNVPMDAPIAQVLRKQVRICRTGDSFDRIKEIMQEFRTVFMPVVDDKNNLVDIHFWSDVFRTKHSANEELLDVQVVVMAGGKGTRLKPITNIIPKPLMPLDEKPIIEVIIDRFVDIGVRDFFISVNYKHEMIRHYFENQDEKPYQVRFVQEEKPLGTAGSLYLLKGKIHNTFFVNNCDIIIDEDYREVYNYHKANSNELTIVGALKHYHIPYGTLDVGDEGLLLGLKEKPDLTFMINSGMYILEPHLLDEIPENELFHITQLMEIIKKRNGRVGVFPVSEGSWLDIGEWKEYNRAQEIYKQKFHEG